jgi:hypothetical protein
LGAKIITVSKKGHMGGNDNLKQYPLFLEELMEIVEEY